MHFDYLPRNGKLKPGTRLTARTTPHRATKTRRHQCHFLNGKALLKSCEMASEELLDIVLQFEPDHLHAVIVPDNVIA